MNKSSGRQESLWMATSSVPTVESLGANMSVDTCVVGAGISGLSVAYQLSRMGQTVAVLEDGTIGSGETGRTTAHLSNAIDDRYREIERLHGARGAFLAADSHTRAIDEIERICGDEGIECDFERHDGYLFTPDGTSVDLLREELDAARRAGLADVTMQDRAPIPSFDTGPCLRFPRQGQFHPMKYLLGLARVIQRNGGKIFCDTHVDEISGGREGYLKTRAGHVVIAQSIVVATNTPINDRVAIHTKQAPYRSYVIGAAIPTGAVARGLYWDTLDPYHYVRFESLPGDAEMEMLIVGGEDHKTAQAENPEGRFGALEQWTRARFPEISGIRFRWSGQVMEPVDGIAFIGRNPMDEENVYIATGDSGQGMTHGTIAGILIRDLILGTTNEWSCLYEPSRKSLRSIPTFLRENLNVAAKYADWVTPTEVSSPDEIPRDSGAVLREGLNRVAVYRDNEGNCHRYAAVCPHLACVVGWNPVEKSWDCPCHGSRFDRFGKVLNGPANSDLKRLGP